MVNADTFVTLGTQGGPLPQPNRSQPANAIIRDDGSIILVDAGDGAAEQLAKAHLSLAKVDTIFLSHMHFDHTAGVLGILALRYQMEYPGTVTIYGPPGTTTFINGLLDSMKPFEMSGFGVPGEQIGDPRAHVKVIEITDGSVVNLDGIKVTAAQNTHYSFPAGSDLDRRYKSLSFRFDMPDRSIVYTGDTGPSINVEKLAKGADILVSEVIDVDKIIAIMRHTRPDIGAEQMAHLVEHQRTQHLSPDEVGENGGGGRREIRGADAYRAGFAQRVGRNHLSQGDRSTLYWAGRLRAGFGPLLKRPPVARHARRITGRGASAHRLHRPRSGEGCSAQ